MGGRLLVFLAGRFANATAGDCARSGPIRHLAHLSRPVPRLCPLLLQPLRFVFIASVHAAIIETPLKKRSIYAYPARPIYYYCLWRKRVNVAVKVG